MARRPRKQITLDDPRAIRALSHPARLTVIDELYSGRVATSTELAALTGLTPSAMSYHMRALEKLGIVERDESATDGRERPWRAAGKGLTFAPLTTRAQHAAANVLTDAILQAHQQELQAYVEAEPDLPQPWQGKGVLNTSSEYLTAEETQQLIDALYAAAEPFRQKAKRRSGRGKRAGQKSRRVRVTFLVVPIVE
ncbi:MAG TPA: helix-turn-helix domain-containing protein [Actinopolymorphaceae bacterium]|mgnify:CR=1 FL=1|jgi:DNA-binding transcriptional ArsR family regulator